MFGLTHLYYFAVACPEHPFFGLPVWYKYLNAAGKMQYANGRCDFVSLQNGLQVQDLSLIGLAVVDILLHIAGLIAVGYIIWGGFKYMTSQGDPGEAKHARQTIINALIGLVISLISVGLVAFIGASIT